MKIRHFFRIVPPIAAIILLIFGLVFLAVGIIQTNRAKTIVNNFESVTGTVVDNAYLSHTDPEDSAKVNWAYHPIVQFTTSNGRQITFTNIAGAYPPKYEIGETVEVYYNPDEPMDALINDWMSLWWGPLIFLVIGSLPIIGMVIWFIVGYIVAEKRFQASRKAYNR